jgi:hypothetical protein
MRVWPVKFNVWQATFNPAFPNLPRSTIIYICSATAMQKVEHNYILSYPATLHNVW